VNNSDIYNILKINNIMKNAWYKTEFTGVRYREHPTRLFSGKSKQKKRPDRYFTIYFRYNGKLFEEGIGWESEGATIEKAVRIRQELKDAQKEGSGPVSLREKRKKAEEKKVAEEHRLETERLANISFGEFFTSTYLPQAVLQKTKKSTDREKQLFSLWISPVIGDLSFKDVGIDYLEKIISNMISANRSPRSIKYAMAVISQVFNYANSRNVYIGQSPTKKIQVPSKDNRRLRFLSHEEASLLLDEIKKISITLYEMSLLSLHTGARAGEIFSLLWGNVDLERNQIYLVDTKTGKNRIAFMTNDVKKMLSTKKVGNPNDFVFVNRNGERYLNPSRTFDRTAEKIGLNTGVTDRRNKVVFHTLRHTFASWLVENGENLYTVKELMGHSTLQMTERYAHLGENTLKKAIQNFPEL
jgi:integrase